MKNNKLFWLFGAAAALSFAACSNDDAVEALDNGATNGDGSTAFMSVVINATGETRATSGETAGDFEQSTTEHEVENANFYFYTAEGAYVTTAEIWDGGTDKTSTTMDDKNIEFEGKTVLVLKDLNQKNAPAYLVTVLNAPAEFTPGNTLAEMEAKLALAANDADGYAYTKDAKTYFMMSTSSYIRTTPANDYEYFTTKVDNTHFLTYTAGKEPTTDQISALQPVQIYVERLAVKVNVGVGIPTDKKVTVDGKDYVKLTVSGGNTTNNNTSGTTIGGIKVADTDLYIAIEGWGLTNLSQNSYMMKNLTDQTATSWHNKERAAGLFRNYWAKAANIYGSDDPSNDILARYALKDYLTSYDAATFNAATATFKLAAGASDYCFENTNNTTAMTSANLGKLATSAMIFARIYQATKSDAGEITAMTPATMISYNGIMFTADDFKAMVLNAIQNNTATDAKKYAYLDGATYKTIDTDDIEFVAGTAVNKGEVTIHLTTAAAAKSWYTYTGATLPTEDSGFTATTKDAVNTALENVIKNTNSDISAKAYMYTGGLMYYNVPIEHYRNTTPANPFVEGDYGVVRNHIYQLSINSLTKLGKAIYDPEQVIIPDTPTEEERYALGVKVNILSWKIVKQDVAL